MDAMNKLPYFKGIKDKNAEFDDEREKYNQNRMQRLLQEGLTIHRIEKRSEKRRGLVKQTKACNLLIRMEKGLDDVLRFVFNAIAPFDNVTIQLLRSTELQRMQGYRQLSIKAHRNMVAGHKKEGKYLQL